MLFKVHYLMEPFCVILKRTLPSQHPLNQILKYHCREVIVPNTFGTPKLVNEDQFTDLLFAHGNTGTARLLRDAHPLSTWHVTDLRAEIKVRCYVYPYLRTPNYKFRHVAWDFEDVRTRRQFLRAKNCS